MRWSLNIAELQKKIKVNFVSAFTNGKWAVCKTATLLAVLLLKTFIASRRLSKYSVFKVKRKLSPSVLDIFECSQQYNLN